MRAIMMMLAMMMVMVMVMMMMMMTMRMMMMSYIRVVDSPARTCSGFACLSVILLPVVPDFPLGLHATSLSLVLCIVGV